MTRQGAAGHREGYSLAFVVVVALFVTALITANVTAVKLLGVFGLVLPAGVLVFPVSYICGDVLTEVYGYQVARRVIWLGFLCNLLAVAAIYLGGVLPAAPFWQDQQAYETILGYTPRLLAASFLAYLVGEFANSYVLARMKVATNGRWLWSRTIGSTLVGQGLDSLVFVFLAFVGNIPLGHDLRHRRPVARQVRLRSPRHAADVRRRKPPQAHRGYRHVRPRHELQPAAAR